MAQTWMEKARDSIILHEGLRLISYKDSLGYPTIGVGFLLSRADARAKLTAAGVTCFVPLRLSTEQAYALLDACMQECLTDLHHLFPTFDTLSDNRKVCLMDMVFNLGADHLAAFHNTLLAINAGQWDKAADGMLASLWAKQVGKRAQDDASLMRNG